MNTPHRCIGAVIFDFDGTLTRPGALDFPALKRALGCPVDRPVLEFIEGMTDAEQRLEAHAALDRFEADAAALSEPAVGAERFLRFLQAQRIPTAILTRNSRASVLRALANFNEIGPTDFTAIISRDDTAAPKPSPDGVLLAAEKLGVTANESLVVGDLVFDIQAGQAAGAMTALIAPDGTGNDSADKASDFCVPSLADLVDVVRMHRPLEAGKFPADLLEGYFKELAHPDPSVLIASAVGEDTAAVNVTGEEVLILKSDPITFATDAIGDYAVVVNANDIATAGATPRWLLTTILFPCGITAAAALAVMEQLHCICSRWQICLCGGHTEITDAVTRTVVIGMMAGTVSRSRLIDKSTIRTGDRVLVTKALAVEGTTIIAREFGDRLKAAEICDQDIEACHHLLSELSIIEEAGIATRSGQVTGMHDVTEGGLATAMEELSAAAGHRIRVDMDRIPVMDLCRTVCHRLDINPLGLIGSGSLLICCRPESAGPIMAAVSDAGIAIAEIGTVTSPGRGVDAFDTGVPTDWPRFTVDEITRLFKKAP